MFFKSAANQNMMASTIGFQLPQTATWLSPQPLPPAPAMAAAVLADHALASAASGNQETGIIIVGGTQPGLANEQGGAWLNPQPLPPAPEIAGSVLTNQELPSAVSGNQEAGIIIVGGTQPGLANWQGEAWLNPQPLPPAPEIAGVLQTDRVHPSDGDIEALAFVVVMQTAADDGALLREIMEQASDANRDAELAMIELQSLISQRQIAVEITQTLAEAINDAQQEIIKNIGGEGAPAASSPQTGLVISEAGNQFAAAPNAQSPPDPQVSDQLSPVQAGIAALPIDVTVPGESCATVLVSIIDGLGIQPGDSGRGSDSAGLGSALHLPHEPIETYASGDGNLAVSDTGAMIDQIMATADVMFPERGIGQDADVIKAGMSQSQEKSCKAATEAVDPLAVGEIPASPPVGDDFGDIFGSLGLGERFADLDGFGTPPHGLDGGDGDEFGEMLGSLGWVSDPAAETNADRAQIPGGTSFCGDRINDIREAVIELQDDLAGLMRSEWWC